MIAYGELNEEHIPDMNKPSVQIYFGVPSVSWSSAVPIFIDAPSWNVDDNKLDTIGGDSQHPIKIFTREGSVEQIILTETTVDSGKFFASFRCTGFEHDADGDGTSDQEPISAQSGSSIGGIQCGREDAITVSWRVTDDYSVLASIPVSWNVGQVKFEKNSYHLDELVKFTIVDLDMTLLPFSLQQFSLTSSVEVNVYSDSDAVGIMTRATEISVASGIFEGDVTLSEKKHSSGDRLYALSGDKIYLRYTDRTLPDPFSVDDEEDIIGVSMVWHPKVEIDKITQQSLRILDQNMNVPTSLKQGDAVVIFSDLVNNSSNRQQFTSIIQVIDETGFITNLSWSSATMSPQTSTEVSHTWRADSSGKYRIESFVWDSMVNANPLAQTSIVEVIVTKN